MESSSEFPFGKPESPPSMGPHHDKRCPLRKLGQRKRLGEYVCTERKQAAQSASTSDGKLVNFDNYWDCNGLSISNLSPVYLQNDERAVEEELRVNGKNTGNSFPEPSMTEMGISYGFTRNKISLRSRNTNRNYVKPLGSIQNCLMAQLYNELTGMDDYVLSYVPSQSSPTLRPFFMTDRRRIISQRGDAFSLQTESRKNKLHKQINSAENETVLGVFPLPYVGSLEFPRLKVKSGKGLSRKLSSSSQKINAKTGTSHGALLFGLGLSVGLISSILANKSEVARLNDMLKKTENLVQDLQDELEMKDALTVKELAVEDCELQDTCCRSYNQSAPNSFCSQQSWDGSINYCDYQKADEDSASMTKIEAELEAELERLELNMNSLSLERRLSNLVELDPDIIPEISRDKLRAEMFGTQADAQAYVDCDGSGISPPHSANYAVSHRELTLRLHEVAQSRLEERVKELETALENSNRKVHGVSEK